MKSCLFSVFCWSVVSLGFSSIVDNTHVSNGLVAAFTPMVSPSSASNILLRTRKTTSIDNIKLYAAEDDVASLMTPTTASSSSTIADAATAAAATESSELADAVVTTTATAPPPPAATATINTPPPTPMQLEIAPQTMPSVVSKPAATKGIIDTSIPPLQNPATPSMDTIALVAGQENYGLAIVLLGEAIWSFAKAPSFDHALKTLVPSTIAAVVLVAVSGPAITSGSPDQVATGLSVATAVSVLMGGVYVARLAAPFSPSPKEIPALGLLVAFAGFFSFGQNLIVDGFVTLPSIPLPSLPTIELPF